MVEQHPALVVPHADVAPCAERLANLHFCPLVNGEEVSAGAVGRGLGIHHTLCDDSLGAGSVVAVERGGSGASVQFIARQIMDAYITIRGYSDTSEEEMCLLK